MKYDPKFINELVCWIMNCWSIELGIATLLFIIYSTQEKELNTKRLELIKYPYCKCKRPPWGRRFSWYHGTSWYDSSFIKKNGQLPCPGDHLCLQYGYFILSLTVLLVLMLNSGVVWHALHSQYSHEYDVIHHKIVGIARHSPVGIAWHHTCHQMLYCILINRGLHSLPFWTWLVHCRPTVEVTVALECSG
jgi:hypothetical protein